MAKTASWLCTLITQLSLCFALYVSLKLGHPQITNGIRKENVLDLYFISVTGGSRSLEKQTLLLRQMEHVASSFGVRFIINTSEHGEDDPLKQNATWLFPSLNVSWYTTRASKEKDIGCFQEQIKLPHGDTLDIIGIDTGSLQERMLPTLSSSAQDYQLNWLKRTLEATNSHWCLVVGFHPLVVCEEYKQQPDAKQIDEPLHHIFMKFGVNAYVSKHGCIKYYRQDSITYIENPDLTVSRNGREIDGFLLHRVGSLEIVTYYVTLEGEVWCRGVTRQRGKEFM